MNREQLTNRFNELRAILTEGNNEQARLATIFTHASIALQNHKSKMANFKSELTTTIALLSEFKADEKMARIEKRESKLQEKLKIEEKKLKKEEFRLQEKLKKEESRQRVKLDKIAGIDDLTKKEALQLLSTSSKKSCSFANFKSILQYQRGRPKASVDRVLESENGKSWLVVGDDVILL